MSGILDSTSARLDIRTSVTAGDHSRHGGQSGQDRHAMPNAQHPLLRGYDHGSVILVEVTAVDPDSVTVRPVPGVTTVVPRHLVTGNPHDTLDHLFTVGEVVVARVQVHYGSELSLRLDDVDDGEPHLPAPSLLPGGPPWLELPPLGSGIASAGAAATTPADPRAGVPAGGPTGTPASGPAGTDVAAVAERAATAAMDAAHAGAGPRTADAQSDSGATSTPLATVLPLFGPTTTATRQPDEPNPMPRPTPRMLDPRRRAPAAPPASAAGGRAGRGAAEAAAAGSDTAAAAAAGSAAAGSATAGPATTEQAPPWSAPTAVPKPGPFRPRVHVQPAPPIPARPRPVAPSPAALAPPAPAAAIPVPAMPGPAAPTPADDHDTTGLEHPAPTAPPAPGRTRTAAPADPADHPKPSSAVATLTMTLAAERAKTAELARELTRLRRSARADAGEIAGLRADAAALQSELEAQTARARHLQTKYRKADITRQNLEKKLHKSRTDGSADAPPSDTTRPLPLFTDPDEQVRYDVLVTWAQRVPASEKSARPLPEYVVGPEFTASLDALEGISRAKVLAVVVDVLTGDKEVLAHLDAHHLRSGDGAGSPLVQRADGARCWRVALQHSTPQARRLHYWRKGDTVELSRVVQHDDTRP
ncbi:hypothetical protein GCM10025865_15620 [Paraoerskovia sediminicola]|uniref:S1 motif domain-containing protein n=1 Tax=Paraoerskovia sediminicola TaxID=1138587 RepID=A0ABM8G2M9_9CELL|nr:hypothetical protein [Paraoerskovia sediminicola]BDZ42263.1 hypothetical protein GCM10025865_15620 [Paraoerskovia sediminicola]